MIRLGAMISSWLGERLGLPAHRVKILVGCGAAAGLAAAYNIPIGGALFAMEVILGNFALEIFGPIVASSVIATLIARALTGNVPLYAAPGYALVERLGAARLRRARRPRRLRLGRSSSSACGAGPAQKLSRLRSVPRPCQPVLGHDAAGRRSALYVPHVLGSGTEHHQPGARGRAQAAAELGLPGGSRCCCCWASPLAKLVATALTAGSGGSGGLFTPSLFFGALVGGAYGFWVHACGRTLASPYGAYAAVGMAAIAAGTSHAPISAILILFEFTGNYDLILPLMVAAIIVEPAVAPPAPALDLHRVAAPAAGSTSPCAWRRRCSPASRPTTWRAPTPRCCARATATPTWSRTSSRPAASASSWSTTDGRLLGAVSLHDIKHALEQPGEPDRGRGPRPDGAGRATSSSHGRAAAPGHRGLRRAATSSGCRWSTTDGTLPRRARQARPAGGLRPGGARPAGPARHLRLQPGRAGEPRLRRAAAGLRARLVPVPAELVGKTLAEARLPQTARRARDRDQAAARPSGEERVIAGGDTRLQPGDQLILLGPAAETRARPLAAGRVADRRGAWPHRDRLSDRRTPKSTAPGAAARRASAPPPASAPPASTCASLASRAQRLRALRPGRADPRFPRYPPLPVVACAGFRPAASQP